MTKIVIFTLSTMIGLATLTSCHRTTLEDRAEKMVKDYTERYCPTPVQDMTITDSISFTRATKTFNYYYTLTDKADNSQAIKQISGKLANGLISSLKESTNLKDFKDASYNFHYIYRSKKNGEILYELTITPKEYKKGMVKQD